VSARRSAPFGAWERNGRLGDLGDGLMRAETIAVCSPRIPAARRAFVNPVWAAELVLYTFDALVTKCFIDAVWQEGRA
jgi:hypothetical protein